LTPAAPRGTWSTRMPMKLVLENGTEFVGDGYGARASVAGEVVFNTGMMGYPEALTDPSYAGQILVTTYPLVGNYGVPDTTLPGSRLQSGRVHVQALVVQQLSRHHSHHLARQSLSHWLEHEGVPIISGIDTRALTQQLRESGTMRGWVFPAELTLEQAKEQARNVDMRTEVFNRVCPAEATRHGAGELEIVLVDVGAKDGILDCLVERGTRVHRVPWHHDIEAAALAADGVLIGNGPGDPQDLESLAARLRSLIGSYHGPIFGVCLGHQLLARAAGFNTYKLRYGHRGCNQPVQDISSGQCYVTSQNHGYAVDHTRPPRDWEPWFVNLNDGTNEGIRLRNRPVFSVQFHPEARPGPQDTEFLFDDFLRLAGSLRRVSRT
jgi:carbamoyl-phosphate synthase small subunit